MGVEFHGLDEFAMDLLNAASMPDEVVTAMLKAGARVVQKAEKEQIAQEGLVNTGKFRASIKIDSTIRKDRDGNPYIRIRPQGTHHRTHSGKAVPNAVVGFIHEFGAPKKKIKATQWMRKANEAAGDEAVEEALKVFDYFMERLGFLW